MPEKLTYESALHLRNLDLEELEDFAKACSVARYATIIRSKWFSLKRKLGVNGEKPTLNSPRSFLEYLIVTFVFAPKPSNPSFHRPPFPSYCPTKTVYSLFEPATSTEIARLFTSMPRHVFARGAFV